MKEMDFLEKGKASAKEKRKKIRKSGRLN